MPAIHKPSMHDYNYGIEIIGTIAYITYLSDSSTHHGSCKDSDFIGNKQECLDFMQTKEITKCFGEFKE